MSYHIIARDTGAEAEAPTPVKADAQRASAAASVSVKDIAGIIARTRARFQMETFLDDLAASFRAKRQRRAEFDRSREAAEAPEDVPLALLCRTEGCPRLAQYRGECFLCASTREVA